MLKFLLYTSSLTLFISFSAQGAEVKKINEKTGGVYLDEGTTTGFSKGAKICIYDGNQKVTCGKIIKALEKKSLARVPKQKINRVQTGFIVSLYSSGGSASEKDTSPIEANPNSISIGLMAHFTPVTVAKFNRIDYLAPETGNTTLWEASSSTSSLLLPPSVGIELEFLNRGLVFGARYGLFQSTSHPNVYDSTQTNLTLTADTSATDIGAYFDYMFFRRWNLNFGLGIDFDMTSISFTGTETSDADATINNELFSITSGLNVISLRVPFSYKLLLGNFAINATLCLLLPLYAMGPNQSVTTPTSTTATALFFQGVDPTTIVPDQDQDLKDSLGHQKNTFGVDFALGIAYQF